VVEFTNRTGLYDKLKHLQDRYCIAEINLVRAGRGSEVVSRIKDMDNILKDV
jgi:hypothetical protein